MPETTKPGSVGGRGVNPNARQNVHRPPPVPSSRVVRETVLTFHSSGDELLALTHATLPFYKPPWSGTIVGLVLDGGTDWDEVAELLAESYRFCAPQKLVRELDAR